MRNTLIAASVGVTIPTLWMIAYHTSETFADFWLGAPSWIENIRLLFWPTSLLLLADPLDKNVNIWVASAMLNGAIYAFVVVVVKLLLRSGR